MGDNLLHSLLLLSHRPPTVCLEELLNVGLRHQIISGRERALLSHGSLVAEILNSMTPEKQNEFNRLIAQDAQRFFWTGGIVDHANQLVGWSNPSSRTIRFSDSVHWSHTGGAGLPQPDNRAAGENPPSEESCLAILNNFYADGIKW